ncbi:spore germination protein [Bacillus sp. S14(2024)]|uniref:spore germination protein n=1 Tax=Bacillus sp. S14(2024) TaxID=3162884 RepID=UPI003D226C56
MDFVVGTFRTKHRKSTKNLKQLQYSDATPLHEELHKNIAKLKDELGDSSDLVIRILKLNEENSFIIAVIHIGGISDEQKINQNIIEPLLECKYNIVSPSAEFLKEELERKVTVSKLETVTNFGDVLSVVLSGNTVIFINGCVQALSASTSEFQSRGITEPTTQTVIRGPKDSFTENLRTNTSLVRLRIQSPCLRLEALKIGTVTQTDVEMMYIEGIADESIVREVRSRLNKIEVDSILESGYVESFIQDKQRTLFPTILNTERPDIVAANVLEGRIALFVRGTPYVLITPVTFVQFFQSPEDYYQNEYIGTALRLLRFGAFFLSMFTPALYIATITHHEALIPTVLLVSIAAQREGVPFPAIVEAVLMEIMFEVLREAGVRMPRAVGQAVSIVGALILGQAAVQAGLVSAAMVIVVSVTAIAGFVIPNYNMAITARILRFVLLLMASFIGLYGLLLSTLFIALHMCSLRSFGVPYVAPIAPFRVDE